MSAPTPTNTPVDSARAPSSATTRARNGGSTLRRRSPILVLGVLSLLAGLWGGLLLLGLSLPTLRASTAADHGPLMALGFLGTVISLERAVALRRAWAFAAPVAAGAGGLSLLVGLPGVVGWSLLCIASVVFVIVYAVVLRIQPMAHLRGDGRRRGLLVCRDRGMAGRLGSARLVPGWPGFWCSPSWASASSWHASAVLTRPSVRHFAAGAGLFGARAGADRGIGAYRGSRGAAGRRRAGHTRAVGGTVRRRPAHRQDRGSHPVHGCLPARRLRLAAGQRVDVAPRRRPRSQCRDLRCRAARGVPRLRDVDDLRPRAGHRAGRAQCAAAVPPLVLRTRRGPARRARCCGWPAGTGSATHQRGRSAGWAPSLRSCCSWPSRRLPSPGPDVYEHHVNGRRRYDDARRHRAPRSSRPGGKRALGPGGRTGSRRRHDAPRPVCGSRRSRQRLARRPQHRRCRGYPDGRGAVARHAHHPAHPSAFRWARDWSCRSPTPTPSATTSTSTADRAPHCSPMTSRPASTSAPSLTPCTVGALCPGTRPRA